MIRPVLLTVALSLPLIAAIACGGSIEPEVEPGGSSSGGSSSGGTSSGGASSGGTSSGGASSGGTSSGGTSSGGTSSGGSSSGGPVVRVPAKHRAVAEACDTTRPNDPSNAPDGGIVGPQAQCQTHEECTKGVNGRCLGNGHDGWRCTYDLCTTDADCSAAGAAGAPGVCACEGGFRSDHNVCLQTGCRVDADCGAEGFCSPSLGSCGNYSGVVTFECHTPTDECIDDADCAGASCRFEPTVGHWQCSSSECAG